MLSEIATLMGLTVGALIKDDVQCLIVIQTYIMVASLSIGNVVLHRTDNGW